MRTRVRACARDRGGEVAARLGQAEAEDAVDAVEVGAARGNRVRHTRTHTHTHTRARTQSRPVFTHTIKAGTGLDRVMPSTPLGLETERRTEAKKGSEGEGRDVGVSGVSGGERERSREGGREKRRSAKRGGGDRKGSGEKGPPPPPLSVSALERKRIRAGGVGGRGCGACHTATQRGRKAARAAEPPASGTGPT